MMISINETIHIIHRDRRGRTLCGQRYQADVGTRRTNMPTSKKQYLAKEVRQVLREAGHDPARAWQSWPPNKRIGINPGSVLFRAP